MPPDDPSTRWLALAEEALLGMRTWRADHPRASWRQIEAELDAHGLAEQSREQKAQLFKLARDAADNASTVFASPEIDEPAHLRWVMTQLMRADIILSLAKVERNPELAEQAASTCEEVLSLPDDTKARLDGAPFRSALKRARDCLTEAKGTQARLSASR